MPTGIMIIGPSGSGKTTLGKIVAQKLGYPYFDVDDYIWKQNTDGLHTYLHLQALFHQIALLLFYGLFLFEYPVKHKEVPSFQTSHQMRNGTNSSNQP